MAMRAAAVPAARRWAGAVVEAAVEAGDEGAEPGDGVADAAEDGVGPADGGVEARGARGSARMNEGCLPGFGDADAARRMICMA